MSDRPRTLFDKVWDAHVVQAETDSAPAVLYIDLHLIHEVTSPQAFALLGERGLAVRRPERTLATMDHSTPTAAPARNGTWPEMDPRAADQLRTLAENCAAHGIALHDARSPQRGIVHVMAPELGATQPGMTVVCGDSHTSTHGAFGALAFGIGTTEVGHVLATQCLLMRKPESMAVNLTGVRPHDVSAKDIILATIGQIGVDAGTGAVIEYRGAAVESMSMEERMTLCNMTIEAGARAGMIAPDEVTLDYLNGRPMAPAAGEWDSAAERWLHLRTDPGAQFDREVTVDVSTIAPQITYGTNPGMVMPIDGIVPSVDSDSAHTAALHYMDLSAGQELSGSPIDVVFIGSCTNGRLSDLRDAAAILRGRRVAAAVRALVVPGSEQVKAAAEAEGLHDVFHAAGAEWREPGCSMCIAMNGDVVGPGQRAVSTSNRNFQGRQGPDSRTFLASPATAAASAVAGHIADPRELAPLEDPNHA